MNEAKERQAAPAKGRGKRSTRKAAPPVPEEAHSGLEPVPIEAAVADIPHRSGTDPVETGTIPEDRSLAPRPEEVYRAKRGKWMKNRARREHQEATKANRPPGPPPDDTEPESGRDNAEAALSKVSGDDSNSPKEVIDLTIKEESPPATPTPLRASEPNKGPACLKAGWVRFPEVLTTDVL